jgi:hypothetical protein
VAAAATFLRLRPRQRCNATHVFWPAAFVMTHALVLPQDLHTPRGRREKRSSGEGTPEPGETPRTAGALGLRQKRQRPARTGCGKIHDVHNGGPVAE